jgi:hypothetical protein
MTQRRQVKLLKVQAVDPPLGVHRIVPSVLVSNRDASLSVAGDSNEAGQCTLQLIELSVRNIAPMQAENPQFFAFFEVL